MNKYLISGKKAQIGDTLTWIVATIIIFFIMVVYLAGVAGIVKRVGINKVTFASSPIITSFYTDTDERIFSSSGFNLAKFMTKKISVNNKETSVQEIISEKLKDINKEDFYPENEGSIIGTINRVSSEKNLNQEQEAELRPILVNALRLVCETYLFVTPFGILGNIEGTIWFKDDQFYVFNKIDPLTRTINEQFGPWHEYKFNVGEKEVIIKYAQKKGC